jgi:hypothetical protein
VVRPVREFLPVLPFEEHLVAGTRTMRREPSLKRDRDRERERVRGERREEREKSRENLRTKVVGGDAVPYSSSFFFVSLSFLFHTF